MVEIVDLLQERVQCDAWQAGVGLSRGMDKGSEFLQGGVGYPFVFYQIGT
jgi:hypothetical protein